MRKKIVIACRASNLAVKQAEIVIQGLKKFYPELQFSLKKVVTAADKLKNISLRNFPQEGVFVKELEKALLSGSVDIAVHSAKDMPMDILKGFVISAVLQREDPRDVLISKNQIKFKNLPYSARIGTGSLRRITQLRNIRRDLNFIEIRGNLETRIKKIRLMGLDGIVIAYAGIKRLGLLRYITEVLDILPSPGQGAICLETRANDSFIIDIAKSLNHEKTFLEISIEKELLRKLGGGCNLPLGALAKINKNRISLKAGFGSLGQEEFFYNELSCSVVEARNLAGKMAKLFNKQGVNKLLQGCK
jgi:hydroxymethylbilane synthase